MNFQEGMQRLLMKFLVILIIFLNISSTFSVQSARAQQSIATCKDSGADFYGKTVDKTKTSGDIQDSTLILRIVFTTGGSCETKAALEKSNISSRDLKVDPSSLPAASSYSTFSYTAGSWGSFKVKISYLVSNQKIGNSPIFFGPWFSFPTDERPSWVNSSNEYFKSDNNTGKYLASTVTDGMTFGGKAKYKAMYDLSGLSVTTDQEDNSNGLYPKTSEDYISVFSDCIPKNDNNKKILDNISTTDNGDATPTISISKQILQDCPFAAMPDMTFKMTMYQRWQNGNVDLISLPTVMATLTSPLIGIPMAIFESTFKGVAMWANDTKDAVRFMFIAEDQPLAIVVDYGGDVAVFTGDPAKGGKDLKLLVGRLGGIWGYNPVAGSGFYSAVVNKVFMANDKCTAGSSVIYPQTNGGAYSRDKHPPAPNNCLYGWKSGKNQTGKGDMGLNSGDDGWLAKWNVSQDHSVDISECSLTKIIDQGDLGKIFEKLVSCILESIFRPMIDWATDLLTKAAGVTHSPTPLRREELAARCLHSG